MVWPRSKKVLLAPFHNRRWDTDFQTIQKLLHEGSLGRLVYFESRFDRWRPDRRPIGCGRKSGDGRRHLLDLGTHIADQALALFGKPEAIAPMWSASGTATAPTTLSRFVCAIRAYRHSWAQIAFRCPRPALPSARNERQYWKSGVDPQEAALNKITRIDDPNWGREPQPTGACCTWASMAAR